MMKFCLKIPVFAKLRERTQHTRVRRFMGRYNPKNVKTAPARAALRESAQDPPTKDPTTNQLTNPSVEESSSESDDVSASSQSSAMAAGHRRLKRLDQALLDTHSGAVRTLAYQSPFLWQAGNMVMGTVVDYCVSRFAKRTEGLVFPVLAAVFAEIVFAYERRTERVRSATEITGDMTWLGKPSGEMVFYHVNSVAGVHEPDYLFAVLKWVFQARHSGAAGTFKNSSFVYVSKPRQANRVDCGIYMLYYLGKVKCYIENHQPRALMDVMRLLTIGSFNSSSAESARASLLTQVTRNA
ncbi:hypothetical protein PHYSODRAFT_329870 [Phytophthora sojae]|uniref:Ubiquitin-like protease family profile domain-containing protein n=1 Tax=Phytophthora sojae (strain P6497) TaxID=1094619 RepID=G4ZAA6_PHYSP|nr:hypothetical protein PHYSODRAFT_329870 [Phytophthora sojae]EGZ21991.1 hypothetical protein PHYSODRAFT_329870 [Phytophthora sojae]|eukprot:XP_009524708.1 hypothetical protein PHYSODRAFT_329870 [Phytophthora sojae]